MSAEKATAILMANLKGAKRKPSNLLEVAKACRILIEKWGIRKMSDYFKVSLYQLRQIDKINDLNPDAQQLVKEGKLGIETSYQLWRLDSKRQSEAAREAVNMTAHEVRQFVYLLRKNPDASVRECKQLFEKTRTKRIRLLMLPLTSETYNGLQELALKSRQSIHDLALKVLEDYILEHKQQ